MKRWTGGIVDGRRRWPSCAMPALAQKEVTIAYQDMLDPYRMRAGNQGAREGDRLQDQLEAVRRRRRSDQGDGVGRRAGRRSRVGRHRRRRFARRAARALLDPRRHRRRRGAGRARTARGINTVADLKGKKIATPFNSTTHFHTIVALEQAHVNPADVQILNMRPPEIRAAWQRGDIQATFIWDPVLTEVKKDGKVITDSGKISPATGKATFDGYVVNKDWAKANHDFMVKFVKMLGSADADYRANKAKWTGDVAEVEGGREVVGRQGRGRSGQHGALQLPDAEGAGSTKWLGGGKNSVAAKALTRDGGLPEVAEADREDASRLLGGGQPRVRDARMK